MIPRRVSLFHTVIFDRRERMGLRARGGSILCTGHATSDRVRGGFSSVTAYRARIQHLLTRALLSKESSQTKQGSIALFLSNSVLFFRGWPTLQAAFDVTPVFGAIPSCGGPTTKMLLTASPARSLCLRSVASESASYRHIVAPIDPSILRNVWEPRYDIATPSLRSSSMASPELSTACSNCSFVIPASNSRNTS